MKAIRKRLTYANVMSSIAVFLVLGSGAAIAAKQLGKKSVGSPQLKANAVTTAKIKKNAVTTKKIKKGAITGAKVKNDSLTGTQINEATLGTVPSSNIANSLVNMSQFKLTRANSSASAATEAEAAAGASQVVLYSDSHFTVYGKCFVDNSGPDLNAVVYIAAKQDGSIFDSNEDELSGDPVDGYLNVGTPEDQREVLDDQAAANNTAIQYEGDTEFGATASDGYTIQGVNQVALKFGNPGFGDGPYGPGDVCLFSGYVLHS